MAVYQIGWKATVYHNEFIEAHSREEADWIAHQLLNKHHDAFMDRLYAGFGDSVAYDAGPCPAQASDGELTASFDELEEWLS